MKTIKMLILLCFIASFAVNNVNAQNGVFKTEETYSICNPLNPPLCSTGDYLCGNVTYEEFYTKQGWVEKVRDGILKGYTDATFSTWTGRDYVLSQVDAGQNNRLQGELTATVRFEGKVVAIQHLSFHRTINANGTITVDFFKFWFDCK
jgi:hypothetical protein